MYISKLIIDGFRGFKHSEIEFQNGLNVIIGHNNGGKSTILVALRLALQYDARINLTAWDFCQNVNLAVLKEKAPSITISVYINETESEDASDDVALFTNYAVATEPLLVSCLTYVFFLPATELDNYKKDVIEVSDKYSLFKIIENKYIRKYTHSKYGGPVERQNQAQSEDLKKIDFQFVDALRNVDSEIYGGRADLLREVLNYFLDYDLEADENKKQKKEQRHAEFNKDTNEVIKKLVTRIKSGKNNIIEYANKTGALVSNNKLNLGGEVNESDLLMVLNLLIGNDFGTQIPIALNGLGYNNLVYISLLLAKMQSHAKTDFMGSSNVKAFSVLAVEEPEAHLHPQMQYLFLQFLRDNINDGHVKQVFVTSHSPSLVAKVDLNELFCLHKDSDGETKIYTPKKVFEGDDPGKKFIQRYLDATRADMLFADGIIFVEGLAEQILLPVFADLMKVYDQWLKKHIIVVNINGRYFDHFIKLYDSKNENALNIKVACITDRDPVRKEKGKADARFKACWPIEYGAAPENYDYKEHSSQLVKDYEKHPNIRFFSQDAKGKTLEYEIARQNFTNKNLVVDSLSNSEEIKELLGAKNLQEALDRCKSNDLKELYSSDKIWENEGDRHIALVASRYLSSVAKGVNSLELANVLNDLGLGEKDQFEVPNYIKEAIKWVLE